MKARIEGPQFRRGLSRSIIVAGRAWHAGAARALVRALGEGAGDTLMDIVRAVCPTVEEVLYVPFEWEFDLENRSGRVKAGDVLETEARNATRLGDSPPPYQMQVTIPGGFEYTGEGNGAETAVATKLRVNGAFKYEHENCHSSMTHVRRGAGVG